ncbi:MAG: NUDIX domain-containing protein [Lachnospiraceae bacterium]|nr:NUDIX domain-containing protein [Lachnospiraceae bacterium]
MENQTQPRNMTTLCYIEQDNKYLMLHRIKKKQDVNAGKWIGVGGHLEPGESPEDCVKREVLEETGLMLTAYKFCGLVTFTQYGYGTEYMSLFTADGFTGTLAEDCNEGVLTWIPKDEIGTLNLWEGDSIFLRLLVERDDFFSLKLEYDEDTLVKAELDGELLEFFDLLDEDGHKTGQKKPRMFVHADGDYHATSHTWLVRKMEKGQTTFPNYEILLQKRSADKDAFPGCYDISSAGHIPAGGEYLSSARRELREELGIIMPEEAFTLIGAHDDEVDTIFYGKRFWNHELSNVYVVDVTGQKLEFSLQTEEVESVRWMPYEEVTKALETGSIPHCIAMDEWKLLGEYLSRS